MTSEDGFKALQKRVVKLEQETKALSPETFREKLIHAYRSQLLNSLRQALDAQDSGALKQVLANNWNLVKGTCLGYTCMPDDDVTKLLCDISETLADVNTPALNILMPGVYGECDVGTRPDLIGEVAPPLLQILQTHIQSDYARYLIPVEQLSELSFPLDTRKVPNHYVPFDRAPDGRDEGWLSLNEIERLFSHSADTLVLQRQRLNYEKLAKDDSTLLGQLNLLIQGLKMNDAYGGIGAEENAGKGAYGYIIDFNEFYSKLSDKQKKEIPETLKMEIELLLNLSSNPKDNVNATKNIATCIGTRKEQLMKCMQGHEGTLDSIKIGESIKQGLTNEAQEEINKSKKMLKESIEKNKYNSGQDKLGLNKRLLQALNVTMRIQSIQALHDFMTLHPQEIIELLSENQVLHADLLTYLNGVEDFVMFCTENSNERLKAIFEIMPDKISEKLWHNIDNIAPSLMAFEGEKLAIVANILSSQLEKVIPAGVSFYSALEALTPEQRQTVLSEALEKLPKIIHSVQDLSTLLCYINPEQAPALIAAVKTELPKMIQTAAQFSCLISWIPKQYRTEVYNAQKERLPGLVKTAEDFPHVLEYLNDEQRREIYDELKIPESLYKPIKTYKGDVTKCLHDAAKKGITNNIVALSKYVDIDTLDENGNTALMLATENNQPEAVSTLLEIGSMDAQMQNASINAALRLAELKNLPDIIALIKDKKAEQQAQQVRTKIPSVRKNWFIDMDYRYLEGMRNNFIQIEDKLDYLDTKLMQLSEEVVGIRDSDRYCEDIEQELKSIENEMNHLFSKAHTLDAKVDNQQRKEEQIKKPALERIDRMCEFLRKDINKIRKELVDTNSVTLPYRPTTR